MQLAVVLHYFHVNMLISSSKVHLCMKYCTLLYIVSKGSQCFKCGNVGKKWELLFQIITIFHESQFILIIYKPLTKNHLKIFQAFYYLIAFNLKIQ